MTKKSSKLENLFCGILFCISIAALVISCLAYTKKKSGSEYFESDDPLVPCCCSGGSTCFYTNKEECKTEVDPVYGRRCYPSRNCKTEGEGGDSCDPETCCSPSS